MDDHRVAAPAAQRHPGSTAPRCRGRSSSAPRLRRHRVHEPGDVGSAASAQGTIRTARSSRPAARSPEGTAPTVRVAGRGPRLPRRDRPTRAPPTVDSLGHAVGPARDRSRRTMTSTACAPRPLKLRWGTPIEMLDERSKLGIERHLVVDRSTFPVLGTDNLCVRDADRDVRRASRATRRRRCK